MTFSSVVMTLKGLFVFLFLCGFSNGKLKILIYVCLGILWVYLWNGLFDVTLLCSLITSNSVIREYFWWDSEDYMNFAG